MPRHTNTFADATSVRQVLAALTAAASDGHPPEQLVDDAYRRIAQLALMTRRRTGHPTGTSVREPGRAWRP